MLATFYVYEDDFPVVSRQLRLLLCLTHTISCLLLFVQKTQLGLPLSWLDCRKQREELRSNSALEKVNLSGKEESLECQRIKLELQGKKKRLLCEEESAFAWLWPPNHINVKNAKARPALAFGRPRVSGLACSASASWQLCGR